MQSTRNACAINAQSLCNRCAIAVQSLRNRFAIAVQSLRNRCPIAAQSLCNRCAIAAQSFRNRCTDAFQTSCNLYNRSAIVVQSQHNRRAFEQPRVIENNRLELRKKKINLDKEVIDEGGCRNNEIRTPIRVGRELRVHPFVALLCIALHLNVVALQRIVLVCKFRRKDGSLEV
jgi:hypothetical protein